MATDALALLEELVPGGDVRLLTGVDRRLELHQELGVRTVGPPLRDLETSGALSGLIHRQ